MNRILDTIKAAMEEADKVPETYRVAAFSEVLRHLLAAERCNSKDGMAKEFPAAPAVAAQYVPEAHVVAESQSRQVETVWAVIQVTSRGLEADAASVRQEIRAALGLKPESRTNTSDRLKRLTPKYLTRRKKAVGRGYCYVPSAHATDVFRQEEGAQR